MLAQVQQLLLRHTPNMVLFHMLDRIFVYVDKESPHIKGNIKKVRTSSVDDVDSIVERC